MTAPRGLPSRIYVRQSSSLQSQPSILSRKQGHGTITFVRKADTGNSGSSQNVFRASIKGSAAGEGQHVTPSSRFKPSRKERKKSQFKRQVHHSPASEPKKDKPKKVKQNDQKDHQSGGSVQAPKNFQKAACSNSVDKRPTGEEPKKVVAESVKEEKTPVVLIEEELKMEGNDLRPRCLYSQKSIKFSTSLDANAKEEAPVEAADNEIEVPRLQAEESDGGLKVVISFEQKVKSDLMDMPEKNNSQDHQCDNEILNQSAPQIMVVNRKISGRPFADHEE